ncbi:MAG TPA: rhodanese-like domain-containing protein [Acidimicrobiales bacterium]
MDVPEIDVDELAARRLDGAPLFDVREPDEYAEAHVPGAVMVPLATVPDQLDRFSVPGPVYVICASGGRSKRAVQFLRSQGIDAVNVAGGTKAWLAAGHPYERGDAAVG